MQPTSKASRARISNKPNTSGQPNNLSLDLASCSTLVGVEHGELQEEEQVAPTSPRARRGRGLATPGRRGDATPLGSGSRRHSLEISALRRDRNGPRSAERPRQSSDHRQISLGPTPARRTPGRTSGGRHRPDQHADLLTSSAMLLAPSRGCRGAPSRGRRPSGGVCAGSARPSRGRPSTGKY